MTVEAGHPWATIRLGTLMLAVSFAVLLVLGASGPAVASSSAASAASTPSAGSIVAEARAAMLRAGSVSAHGGGTTTTSDGRPAVLAETDYSAATSGTQVLATTSGTAPTANLPSATTVDLSGAVYVNANAPFWTSTVGMGLVPATQIAGRWVRVPRSSPVYAAAAADLTMPSLIQDIFHASSYHKGAVRTVDGVRAVAITYRNSGNDSGPVTCYVAVGGSHLPVQVTIGRLSLHLGSWGRAQPISAPPGAVPLPGLATSTASALPVVA